MEGKERKRRSKTFPDEGGEKRGCSFQMDKGERFTNGASFPIFPVHWNFLFPPNSPKSLPHPFFFFFKKTPYFSSPSRQKNQTHTTAKHPSPLTFPTTRNLTSPSPSPSPSPSCFPPPPPFLPL